MGEEEVKLGLHFGDCLAGMAGLPDGSVHCVVTDPPYGIDFQSNHRKSISVEEVVRPVEGDEKFNPAWFDQVFASCRRILADNTHIYAFTQDIVMAETIAVFKKHFDLMNVIAWDKDNWGMGSLEYQWAKQCEFILFGQKGRREFCSGRRPTSLIKCPRVPPEHLLHSCEKPISLIGFLLEHSTFPGEVVCDPFTGSGTTAIAASSLGRKFVGWEVDPKTYEIARNRIAEDALQMRMF